MLNQKKTLICHRLVTNANIGHDFPGDTHSCCSNRLAVAIGDEHGISHGWFFHPFNFDPVWLRYCDGFEEMENTNEEEK